MTRLSRALVAVIVGNALYFVVVMPVLPRWLGHAPYQLDAGLALDFAICLALYALFARLAGVRRGAGDGGPGGGGRRW